MAKIRSKQLADFVSTYSSITAATDILNAAAVNGLVSTAAAGVALDATNSIDSLESQVSSEVSRAEAAEGVLQGNIDTVQGNLDTVETTLAGNITAEESRAMSAEVALNSSLSLENVERLNADSSIVTAYSTADASLTTRLSTEEFNRVIALSIENASGLIADNSIVTAYTSADTSLSSRLSTEEATREAAATELSNSIDSIESNLASNISLGVISTAGINASIDSLELLGAGNMTEVNSSVDSLEFALTSADGSIAVAYSQADASLTNRISTEETARSTADSSIVTAYESADTSLSLSLFSNLSVENVERLNADSSIVTAYSTADSSLTSRLSTEEATNSESRMIVSGQISNLESIDTAHTAAISSLENAIMQDFDMVEEILTGIETAVGNDAWYTLMYGVQDSDAQLVQVFINGVKAKVTGISGMNPKMVVVEASYAIDTTDVVTFLYQASTTSM